MSDKKPPPDSLFSQQRIPSWQPIINVGTTWTIFIGIGIIITSLGIALLVVLNATKPEIKVEYASDKSATKCKNNLLAALTKPDCRTCADLKKENQKCQIEFEIKKDEELKVPVYVFYQLTNFYQNHRTYVNSRDDLQLSGNIFKDGRIRQPDGDGCKKPFRSEVIGKKEKYYFPCGAAANAMFSDRFTELKHSEKGKIDMSSKAADIVWTIEMQYKYIPPVGVDPFNHKANDANHRKNQKLFDDNFIKPPNWSEAVYKEWWKDGGMRSPHFINWMHQAPMSSFRKLYAVIRKGCDGGEYLCAGNYTLTVDYNFQPKQWDGTRVLIFAKTSFFGTRKPFMAYCTLLFGIFCIIVGIIFFILKKTIKVKVHPHTRHSMEPDGPIGTNPGDAAANDTLMSPSPVEDVLVEGTGAAQEARKSAATTPNKPPEVEEEVKRTPTKKLKKQNAASRKPSNTEVPPSQPHHPHHPK